MGRLKGGYSQHFTLIITYKWAQYALVSHYTRLERLARYKHSSFLTLVTKKKIFTTFPPGSLAARSWYRNLPTRSGPEPLPDSGRPDRPDFWPETAGISNPRKASRRPAATDFREPEFLLISGQFQSGNMQLLLFRMEQWTLRNVNNDLNTSI